MRLANKVAVITGSGSGIGEAEALLFAREGARVVVNDIQKDKCQRTVDSIKAAGGEASLFVADVSKAAEVKSLMDFAVKTYGKLNILINNAGIGFVGKGDGPVTDVPEPIWDKLMDVNLKGTFLCCKYAVPHMLKSDSGAIVNTSSIAALIPAVSSGYAAAKAGVIALTRSIAFRYVKQNIRANTICPGRTETPLLKDLAPNPEAMKELLKLAPMGRFAKPIEIAYAALFLASDEASYVTGAVLVVGGGDGI